MSEKWYIKYDTLVDMKKAIYGAQGKDTSKQMFVNQFATNISSINGKSHTETVYFKASPKSNISLQTWFSNTNENSIQNNLLYVRWGREWRMAYSYWEPYQAYSRPVLIEEDYDYNNRKFIRIPMYNLTYMNKYTYLCIYRTPFVINNVTYYGVYLDDNKQLSDLQLGSDTDPYTQGSWIRSDKSDYRDQGIFVIRK